MAATEPIVDVLIKLDPNLDYGPDWTPEPMPKVGYPGSGTRALWDDVWAATKGFIDLNNHGRYIPDPITGKQVQAIIDAANVEMVKTYGGFINQATAFTVQAAQLLEDAIQNLTSTETNDFLNQSLRSDQIDATQQAILTLAIPALQAQINQLKADIPKYVQYAVLSERAWTEENIFKPLYTELLKVQPAIDRSITQAKQEVTAQTDLKFSKIPALIAAAVAPLASGLGKLLTEDATCVADMCATQGPKTNLGKLLKGLSAALDAGLLAEIATAHESDVVDAITRIANHAMSVINTFENDFVKGGQTLAGLVTNELKNII